MELKQTEQQLDVSYDNADQQRVGFWFFAIGLTSLVITLFLDFKAGDSVTAVMTVAGAFMVIGAVMAVVLRVNATDSPLTG